MDWYSDGTAFYAGRFEDQICNWIFLVRLFELKSIFLYCWFACGFFFSKFKFFGFLFFFTVRLFVLGYMYGISEIFILFKTRHALARTYRTNPGKFPMNTELVLT